FEVILDLGALPRPPLRLEPIADPIQLLGLARGQRTQIGSPAPVRIHGVPSAVQRLRITSSFRSTVLKLQSRLRAISSLLYPSSFSRATLGAPCGALTSNRGGALALRASISVIGGFCGSLIGNFETEVLGTCQALTPGLEERDQPNRVAAVSRLVLP